MILLYLFLQFSGYTLRLWQISQILIGARLPNNILLKEFILQIERPPDRELYKREALRAIQQYLINAVKGKLLG